MLVRERFSVLRRHTLRCLLRAGDEDADHKRSTESDTQWLPSITENGIRLGTPVAREAAKSFWSMAMLKTSLNRMAFYADCENQGSLGSPDSGFHSSRATPTLPQLASSTASSSASSSPQSVTRYGWRTPPVVDADSDDESAFLGPPFLRSVSESPLLMARRQREAIASSTPTPHSNPSTVSLTSSSKTISPSHSSQTLLPRRRLAVHRSHSANHLGRELKLPQREMKLARSDTCLKSNSSLNTELHHISNFLLN